jgi:hypothetical protein
MKEMCRQIMTLKYVKVMSLNIRWINNIYEFKLYINLNLSRYLDLPGSEDGWISISNLITYSINNLKVD